MGIEKDLISLAKSNPKRLRNILEDTNVQEALSSIGVLPKILELHAPSTKSKKMEGLGKTLCGINGTRHKLVTCGRCLKKLS